MTKELRTTGSREADMILKKAFTRPSKGFVISLVAVAALALGMGLWIHYGFRPKKMPVLWFWRVEKGRPIPGWKEDQDALRRDWKIVYDPPVEGLTDVFYATRGGIERWIREKNTILAWRMDGKAYIKREFKAGEKMFDLTEGAPIDSETLDALLSMKSSLDSLAGLGSLAMDQGAVWIYIRRGASEGKYLLFDGMLWIDPPAVPDFYKRTDDLWVAPPAK